MERDVLRHTQFEPPGPVMGGMRWGDGRPRLVDFCQRTGIVYRKYKAEEILPAPVVHVGPSIVTTAPEAARAGQEYVYQPRAIDSGVNGFTWSFVTPPPAGMEIDRYGGKITWTPAESCRVRVEIRAYTHHGRQTTQAWPISVGKAAVVRACVPHPRFVEALRRKRLRLASSSRRSALVAAGPPSTQSSSRIPSASSVPGHTRPKGEAPLMRAATTGPPLPCCWRDKTRMTGSACRATAPLGQRPAAAVIPLRL